MLDIPTIKEINPKEEYSGEVRATVGLSLEWVSKAWAFFINYPKRGLVYVEFESYYGKMDMGTLRKPKRMKVIIIMLDKGNPVGWRFPGDF